MKGNKKSTVLIKYFLNVIIGNLNKCIDHSDISRLCLKFNILGYFYIIITPISLIGNIR